MIRRIRLDNFKPFSRTLDIPLAPITLVYGPNSSGKSSLIQSLLMFSQTLTAEGGDILQPRGNAIDLGSFDSLIHRHETDRLLRFFAEFSGVRSRRILPGIAARPSQAYRRAVGLTYAAVPEESSTIAELSEVQFQLLDEFREALHVNMERQQFHRNTRQFTEDYPWDRHFSFIDEESRESLAAYLLEHEYQREENARRRGRDRYDDPPTSASLAYDDLINQYLERLDGVHAQSKRGLPSTLVNSGGRRNTPLEPRQAEILQALSSELIELFDRISYLGPMRIHQQRFFVPTTRGQMTVGHDGSRTMDIISERPELLEKLNTFFARFEIPYLLDLQEFGTDSTGRMGALVLTDKRTKTAVSPTDVGFGISQLLPVLVQAAVAADQQIICVEQPEIHLHPRLQAHLADLFIESTGMGEAWQYQQNRDETQNDAFFLRRFHEQFERARNQWIVETHSELLILRLQRRIRERVIPFDAVSVLYVEPQEGCSVVRELRLDEDGNFLDEWPQGFFDDGFSEQHWRGDL